MLYTKLKSPFIEQHFHGCFGINFNTCTQSEVLFLAHKIKDYGIGGIFPTLVTDTVENLKRQINIIKKAAEAEASDSAKILGIHLEAVFLNPQKKGIHNKELLHFCFLNSL